MNHPQYESPYPPPPEPSSIPYLLQFGFIYLLMTGIGLTIMRYGAKNLVPSFSYSLTMRQFQESLWLILLGVSFLLVLSYLFSQWFASYRQLKKLVTEIFSQQSRWQLVFLAFLSAFGEEVLFRGGLQYYLGIPGTALLFGIIHLGPSGKPNAWSFWAFLAGLVLGLVFEKTGSLWPVIAIHFLVNAFSLLQIKSSHFGEVQTH